MGVSGDGTIFDRVAEKYDSSIWFAILWWIVALAGTLRILSLTSRLLKTCCRHKRKENTNLYQKYGDKLTGQSWAVVTGGSDGLGLGYCKEFAKQGFNICIIARNKDKIEQKFEEIKKSGCDEKIQFKAVIADFSEMSQISDYDHIEQELKSLDIGILVFNAGWADTWYSDKIPESWVKLMVNMNVSQIPFLTRKLLPQIRQRNKKESAIIYVSSIAAVVESPFGSIYYASKAYVTAYAKCLYYELKPLGIDVISYNPAMMDTQALKDVPQEKRKGVISPEEAAKVSLRDLGIEPWTLGTFTHEMFASIFTLIKPSDHYKRVTEHMQTAAKYEELRKEQGLDKDQSTKIQ